MYIIMGKDGFTYKKGNVAIVRNEMVALLIIFTSFSDMLLLGIICVALIFRLLSFFKVVYDTMGFLFSSLRLASFLEGLTVDPLLCCLLKVFSRIKLTANVTS